MPRNSKFIRNFRSNTTKIKMTIQLNTFLSNKSPNSRSLGALLFEKLNEGLKKSENIELSFEGISNCSSAFLNASIGKLYLNFDQELIKNTLNLTNVDDPLTAQKIEDTISAAANVSVHQELVDFEMI